jgi:hypothetical protein
MLSLYVEYQNILAEEGDGRTCNLPLDRFFMQEIVARRKGLRCHAMHPAHLPTSGDVAGLRRLRVNLTSEPQFASKNLSDQPKDGNGGFAGPECAAEY